MKILVDSAEYKGWHELGHATICLHLGGDVKFIEFLTGDARGHARTRCVVTSKIAKSVACGGFAAEFLLLNRGYAELSPSDTRDLSRIIFHNATDDREDFWERRLNRDEQFSAAEDTAYMHHAIGPDGHGGLIPILTQHFSTMQVLVRELCNAGHLEGRRIRQLLRDGNLQ